MNKRVLNISLFLLLASTGNVLAQQGIGTNTPHRSAALHVDSQNKGLLIPRINLTHTPTEGITAPITNPAQGLLVYNNQSYPVNATGQDVLVPEGFYYFDGTNWNPISKSYLENSSYTTILGTGTSSDPYKINLVHASSTEYGVVKIGDNINVTDGVISVNFPPNTIDTNTTTTVSTTQSYITVESSHTDGNSTSPLQTVNYDIGVDPATETSLGVVAPGEGLAIADGILSVDISTIENKGNLTSTEGDESITVTNGTGATLVNTNIKVSDLGITTGKLAEGAVTSIKIADGTIETIDIKDSAVTPAKVKAGTNNTVLSTDESGNVVWVNKSTLDTDTTYSAGLGISLDGTQFSVPVTTIGNGNVLTGVTATATGLEFTKEPFAATDTRTKVEAIANRPITVTSNAFTVGEENTYTLDLKVGSGLEVESDGTLKVAFNDTDNQTLNFDETSKKLSIVRGNEVDLSVIDTDNQQISYDESTKILSLQRGGNPIDLSTLAIDTKTKVQAGTNVTVTPTTDPTDGSLNTYTVNVAAAVAQVGTTAGTLGVVKPSDQFEIASDGHLKIKYATPEFFYMPALLIPLSGQANIEGFLSLDLYGEYQERFNSPAVVSANSELANLSSLVVPIDMLDIYITYYDEQVLEDVSIDTDGKMWYKVKANYNYTEASFMNVVFKIRNQSK